MCERVEVRNMNVGEKNVAVTAVFKIHMHCNGCAEKVKRAAKHLDGVSDVKVDLSSNRLTLTGKVDPVVIKTKLEQKTKKKIEIVSSQPIEDADDQNKPDEKTEKKTNENMANEIGLYFRGCIQKIRKTLIKFKDEEIHVSFKKSKLIEINFTGVNEISIDAQKNLITAKCNIEGKDHVGYLNDKSKRSVEVVPLKIGETASAGDDKKEKETKCSIEGKDHVGYLNDKFKRSIEVVPLKIGETASAGGDKKEKEAGGGDGGDKASTSDYFHGVKICSDKNPNSCPIM